MIRIVLLLLIAGIAFVVLRFLLGGRNITNRQFGLIYVATLLGIVLLYLGMSGRLPWLLGLLGAALPFIAKRLPWIFRIIGLRRVWQWLRNIHPHAGGPSGGSSTHEPGQTSALNTRFFAMILDHDTGHMDGEILEGPNKGAKLSELSLSELLALLPLVNSDPDSENVLRAYLDREHPDWTDHWQQQQTNHDGAQSENSSDVNLTVRQAYEILGIEQGANKDDVKDAHRRLMQRVHPDRGGSAYLAARINKAKSVLLAHLDV